MMGYGSDRGIIPLICEALFERIKEREAAEEGLKFTVEVRIRAFVHSSTLYADRGCLAQVSYTEIYQESERLFSIFHPRRY